MRTKTKFALLISLFLISVVISGLSLGQSTESTEQQIASQAILERISQEGSALVFVALDVSVSRSAGHETRRAAVAQAQNEVIASLSTADFQVTHRFHLVHGLGGYVLNANGLNALLSNNRVLDVVLSPTPELHNLEAGQLVNADDVWALGFTGAGVRVAVIDTGIDNDHPDLVDSIIGEKCFVASQSGCPGGVADQAPDGIGHGSHVAGTITSDGEMAVIGEPGLAPDAGVYMVKVFGNNGSATGNDLLAAIDWIGTNQGTIDIDIVNMSLGFPSLNSGSYCDTTFDAFVDSLFVAIGDMDAITFVSAGNSGNKSQISVPACFSNTISVGAVYTGNFGSISWSSCTDPSTSVDQVTCFSQSAPILDILGPGALIDSTVPNDTYDAYGGTSMSSPASAAVAALLLEAAPLLTQAQLLTLLQETGVSVTDAANGRVTSRIDALAAYNDLEDVPTLTPTVAVTNTPEPTATDTPEEPTTVPTDEPTNTPGGPTETPTDEATVTPTEEAGVELVINGGFENLGTDGKPDVTPWVIKNASGDKAKCNKDKDGDGIPDKIFSNTGDCAFVFKGVAGEAGKIQQTLDLSAVVPTVGDGLNLSFFAESKSGATVKTKVVVKYADDTKTKITVESDGTEAYTEFTGSEVLTSADVSKAKINVSTKSTSGKVNVDDVNLKYLAAGSLIPLPSDNSLNSSK